MLCDSKSECLIKRVRSGGLLSKRKIPYIILRSI
jgi:hypothetical protein